MGAVTPSPYGSGLLGPTRAPDTSHRLCSVGREGDPWEAHEVSLWALGEGQAIEEAADPSGVRYVHTGDIKDAQTVDPTKPIG